MTIEQKQLTHNIYGQQFINIESITYAVTKNFFSPDSYRYLLGACQRNRFKTNLIPINTFEDIMNKHPKKRPCWCLSGMNFIDCHFNKRKSERVEKNQIFKLFKNNFTFKECLHKNVSSCSDQLIKAHSISRKNSLESISVNQHVYGMKFDYSGLNFSKLGIKNASTFTGFCKMHDEILFSSFEKNNFQKTSKQLFDLCYRAICIEYNSMQSVYNLLNLNKKIIDNSLNIAMQISKQISINSQIFFYKLGLKYSDYYKHKMEELYKKSCYEDLLEHYIFELADGYPKFQSSTCFNLDFDLDGNQIQDLDDAKSQSKNLFINCLTLNGNGYFILSWFKENHKYGLEIIESIINDPRTIEDKLFSLVFLYIHNTYVSPEWYENLTSNQRGKVSALQNFWNEKDIFSISMICSNFDSLKIKKHGFH